MQGKSQDDFMYLVPRESLESYGSMTFIAAEKYIEERSRSRSAVSSKKTLEDTEKNRATRVAGRTKTGLIHEGIEPF